MRKDSRWGTGHLRQISAGDEWQENNKLGRKVIVSSISLSGGLVFYRHDSIDAKTQWTPRMNFMKCFTRLKEATQ